MDSDGREVKLGVKLNSSLCFISKPHYTFSRRTVQIRVPRISSVSFSLPETE